MRLLSAISASTILLPEFVRSNIQALEASSGIDYVQSVVSVRERKLASRV